MTRKPAPDGAEAVPSGPLDLERLYREHGHVVVRRASRILGDDAEAAEVLQEVFLSLLARPEQFEGRSAVTTFLYSMTTNACLNRLRNRRRRAVLLASAPPSSQQRGSEAEATVDAALVLSRLPERLARVAIYYYLDEMTHDEIAALLGISRRHVGNLISRIQEACRGARAA